MKLYENAPIAKQDYNPLRRSHRRVLRRGGCADQREETVL